MTPDAEIQLLHARMKLHDTFEYKHPENNRQNIVELVKEYDRVKQYPVSEVTADVWNNMDLLAAKIGVKHSADD